MRRNGILRISYGQTWSIDFEIPFAVWNARPIYIFTLLILFPNFGACTSTAMEEKKKNPVFYESPQPHMPDWGTDFA